MLQTLHRPACLALLVAAVSVAGAARAEVTRVDVQKRADLGATGYEKIVGRLHFAVDPRDPRNAVVADLDKAPRNAAGKVEFAADLYVLKPKAAAPNAVALVEVLNRGRKLAWAGFNRAAGATDPSTPEEIGDGFLMRRGYTLVWVGWQFDVVRQGGAMGIEVPVAGSAASPVGGLVRATLTPTSRAEEGNFADLRPYAIDGLSAENALTVRDAANGPARTIPRDQWSIQGTVVRLRGGFEAGRTYEATLRSTNPPIAGLGFAAVRDAAAWLRHGADSVAPSRYVYTFGASQSGRFLRDFLYHGFNTDERGRQVFDAALVHIAGASRTNLNERWSVPSSQQIFGATSFPFSDRAQRDPVTGIVDGLLENPRAREHQPKIFYTNTAVEYWGGGRSAALLHTTPDGSKDVPLLDNVRVYFLTGAQHTPSRFPPRVNAGQQPDNPLDYWWALRSLVVAMDKWVREGTAPPASRYPRLADRTLVRAADAAFPAIPRVASPRTLSAGVRMFNHLMPEGAGAGAALPLFVPQVDADGNETAGLRLPDVAVPLATFTGWNFRNPSIGNPTELMPLIGSYIVFPHTKHDRGESGDPRRSIEERYASRDAYLQQVKSAAAALVKGGYLLDDDVAGVVHGAEEAWTLATRP